MPVVVAVVLVHAEASAASPFDAPQSRHAVVDGPGDDWLAVISHFEHEPASLWECE
jgi:hypothetical protein